MSIFGAIFDDLFGGIFRTDEPTYTYGIQTQEKPPVPDRSVKFTVTKTSGMPPIRGPELKVVFVDALLDYIEECGNPIIIERGPNVPVPGTPNLVDKTWTIEIYDTSRE